MNVMKTIRQLFLSMLLAVLAISGPVYADTKVGFVNADKLLENSPQGKQVAKDLEGEFSGRQRELLALRDEAVALEQSIAKNSLLLTDDEKAEKTQKLVELQRRFQREQRELNEDINLRRNEELSKLQKVISEAVVKVAEAQGYDIVFQQAVWFKPSIDMTQAVLDHLEKNSR